MQGDPLPKRLKVVQKSRTGQPVVDLTFTSWDLAPKITDATFVPKVPAEYEGIASCSGPRRSRARRPRHLRSPRRRAKK